MIHIIKLKIGKKKQNKQHKTKKNTAHLNMSQINII